MKKLTRAEVYALIDGERDYQDREWPDDDHQVGAYLTMLQTYMNAAHDAWTYNKGDDDALDVIRKIAGIAVRAMEVHGAPARGKRKKKR